MELRLKCSNFGPKIQSKWSKMAKITNVIVEQHVGVVPVCEAGAEQAANTEREVFRTIFRKFNLLFHDHKLKALNYKGKMRIYYRGAVRTGAMGAWAPTGIIQWVSGTRPENCF